MAITTNSNYWIEGIDKEDFHEVYCLYKSVTELIAYGKFVAINFDTQNGSIYWVSSRDKEDVLILSSREAREQFVELIKREIWMQNLN